MNRFGTAFVVSVLLHVGLFMLAYISWTHAPKTKVIASVPVEIVSRIPSREQAEAPVDKLAVKPPVPEPAPVEPPKPEPVPTPAPKLPIPAPLKPAIKTEPAKPDKAQPKAATAPPSKDGLKKPEPPKNTKPALDLDALSQMAASPSKSKTRNQPQANTRRTDGASNYGSAAQDAGVKNDAYAELAARLMKLWTPNCDVPGGDLVQVQIKFTISPNGRVIDGPTWINPRKDPVWEAGAARAMQAVKRGEPYIGLPDSVYGKPIPPILFDATKACHGQ